jgi:hypothetical protein
VSNAKASQARESAAAERFTPAQLASGAAFSLAMGTLAGSIAGLVWGGIGGRIAMRVLFLTSSDAVKGLTSDDGFEIGRISGDTIFLLIAMTFVGGILGGAYGLLRLLLQGPLWLVTIGIAVMLGTAVGGGVIVSAEGVDFRFLEPLWLAVGLFIFLPAAWGITIVLGVERLVHWQRMHPEPGVDAHPFGIPGTVLGWGGLAAVSILGFLDLLEDLERLT